ncbi:hypothetical protein NDU88_004983 [Pleurodeles waltl]|uniref:Uncharacterized protein n=1 Tax=Pleurodeles waltl TaxID=8319 RepID=A0AAV7TST3_PLEWA|nr:hypothetical protein NDU88_004983 [Pleurodeles waltl]
MGPGRQPPSTPATGANSGPLQHLPQSDSPIRGPCSPISVTMGLPRETNNKAPTTSQGVDHRASNPRLWGRGPPSTAPPSPGDHHVPRAACIQSRPTQDARQSRPPAPTAPPGHWLNSTYVRAACGPTNTTDPAPCDTSTSRLMRRRGLAAEPPVVGAPQLGSLPCGSSEAGRRPGTALALCEAAFSPHRPAGTAAVPAAPNSPPDQGNHTRQLQAASPNRIKDGFRLLP